MNNKDNDSHDEDLDWAELENMTEESTILDLIRLKELPSNLFNTMGHTSLTASHAEIHYLENPDNF